MTGYFDAVDGDRTDFLESLFYSRSAIEETITNEWFHSWGRILSSLITWALKKEQAYIENVIQKEIIKR